MTTITAVRTPGPPDGVQVDVASAPTKPTPAYSSNFTAGVDSWSPFGTGVGLTNDTGRTPAALKLTAPTGTLTEVHAARALSGLTIGASYRITAFVQTSGGAVKLAARGAAEGTEIAQGPYLTVTGRAAISLTFTATITTQVIEIFTKALTAVAGVTPTAWADTITVDPTTWLGTTITRTDANGTNVPVRLSPGLDTVGTTGFTIMDFEAALTGAVTYNVTDGLGGTASCPLSTTGGPTITMQQVVVGTQGSIAASSTFAMTVPPVAGDIYVVWRSVAATSSVVTGLSGLGATWSRIGTPGGFSGYFTEWWIGVGATASGTITVTASGSVNGAQRAFHIRGLTAATTNLVALQQTTSAASLTGTPVNAQLGQIVLQSHYALNTSSIGTVTQTPAAGWTNGTVTTSAVYGSRNTGYRVPTESVATAHNATVTPPASTTLAIENLVIGAVYTPPPTTAPPPTLTLPATGLRTSNLDAPDYEQLTMVTNYEAARETLGAVHAVIGRQTKLSNPGPLSARAGTLEIWAATYADALAVVDLLDSGEVAMFRQSDYPGMDMYFATRAATVRPEPPTATRRWTVQVAYDEVPRP